MGNGKVPPVRPFPLMAGLPAHWYQVGKGVTERVPRGGVVGGGGHWGHAVAGQIRPI
jgi:hypothetical protein